jgi:hypothetical protein
MDHEKNQKDVPDFRMIEQRSVGSTISGPQSSRGEIIVLAQRTITVVPTGVSLDYDASLLPETQNGSKQA